jgi:hypothetical protein
MLRLIHSRGASNDRHERNRVRGTVIIISTVVMYLVSSSFSYRRIYISRRRVMQGVIKGGVGNTPETLVGDAQIQYEVDRPCSAASRCLHASDPGCGPLGLS